MWLVESFHIGQLEGVDLSDSRGSTSDVRDRRKCG